ncbi:MAG TPA: hypothetical protein VN844_18915, partial [Pyrinomonadaceae bacterium]|nr:hypothetical protein [Pyrinomonadaceae bacterium]
MTTSVSNDEVSVVVTEPAPLAATQSQERSVYRIRHTLASRFVFLVICVAIVTSALAYGTVHYWALALFNLGALTVLILWVADGWRLGNVRISRNLLQLPLLGAVILGLVQMLPFGGNTLSLDPNSTKLVVVQLSTLCVYFAATLVFVDTPHRLHVLVRTIMIFGFLLAIFGLTQSFISPTKVYGMRELSQSTAFGPFINRHHFAGYMELTISLPLGLLLAGSIDKEKRLLYLFVAGLMGVALVMTSSRGGIISLVGEIVFLVIVTAIWKSQGERERRRVRSNFLKGAAARVALAAALIVGLFMGVILLGGEFSLNRFIDSVNTDDPTTGRAHF